MVIIADGKLHCQHCEWTFHEALAKDTGLCHYIDSIRPCSAAESDFLLLKKQFDSSIPSQKLSKSSQSENDPWLSETFIASSAIQANPMLYPLRFPLRCKIQRRCIPCDSIVIKPELKASSAKFRIKQIALKFIPNVSVFSHQPNLIVLRISNPLDVDLTLSLCLNGQEERIVLIPKFNEFEDFESCSLSDETVQVILHSELKDSNSVLIAYSPLSFPLELSMKWLNNSFLLRIEE